MTDGQRQRPRERNSPVWARRKSHASRAIAVALVVLASSACSTEYHGPYSDIDGVLWRQVAGFEDPFTDSVYQSRENDPNALVESLSGTSWDGTSESAERIHVADGGVVTYDVSSAAHEAAFSVFVSSGPRADQTAGRDETYTGPSAVFTCYRLHVYPYADATPAIDRIILDECPNALVEAMPDDAAFASGEVFDG
jgi:hypothetical protein